MAICSGHEEEAITTILTQKGSLKSGNEDEKRRKRRETNRDGQVIETRVNL